MKATTYKKQNYYICTQPGAHRFPNSAERRITIEKLIEGALAAAIVLGVVVITIVLLTM